jgi:hypothetical protein
MLHCPPIVMADVSLPAATKAPAAPASSGNGAV